jgi:hypothetical protein
MRAYGEAMTGDQVIARLFFEMTQVIHKTYRPDMRFGTFLDLVPVGYAIFLGQAEGRPMGLTGLARFLDIPRSSAGSTSLSNEGSDNVHNLSHFQD